MGIAESDSAESLLAIREKVQQFMPYYRLYASLRDIRRKFLSSKTIL